MIKNKKLKLIVGGCSYTYGGNDKDTIPWPNQLAELLDMELVNTSRNGVGNEYILGEISKAICSYNNIGLVVAMWSEFERIDFPQSLKTKRWQYPDRSYVETEKQFLTTVNANVVYDLKKDIQFPKSFRRYVKLHNEIVLLFNENGIYTKLKCLVKSLSQMMLFKQLVKSKGLDYIHCVGTNPYIRGEETAEDIKTKIQQYSNAIIDSIFFDELDETNFIGFPMIKNIGGFFFDDLLPEPNLSYRVSESDSHPNTKGHKIFADHIYEKYKEIYHD